MPPLPPWCLTYNNPANSTVPLVGVAQIDVGEYLAVTAGQLSGGGIGDTTIVLRGFLDGACWGQRAVLTTPVSGNTFALASRLPFGTPNAALLGGDLDPPVSYVRLTVDGGLTWTQSTPDPGDLSPGSQVAALVALSASDWLGIGQFENNPPAGRSNVIVSADGGATWTNIGVIINQFPLTFPPPLFFTIGAAAALSDGSVVVGGCRPDAPDVWTTFRSLGPPWTVWTASAPFPGTYPPGFNGLTRVLSITDCGGGVVMATLGPGFSMTDGAGDNPIWVVRSVDFGQTWALLDPLLDIVNAPFFPSGSPHMTATAGAVLSLGGGDVVLGLGGFQTPGDNPLWAPGWRVSHDTGLTFPDQGTAVNVPGGSAFWAQPLAMTPRTGGVISVGGGFGGVDPTQQQIWTTFTPPLPACQAGAAAHFRSRTAAHQAALSVSRRAHGVRG